MIDEIDDFVDGWHDDPRNLPLYEHLGFTKDEYALWLRSPDSLQLILNSRKHKIPLGDAPWRGVS
jgi:hypothetical protein